MLGLRRRLEIRSIDPDTTNALDINMVFYKKSVFFSGLQFPPFFAMIFCPHINALHLTWKKQGKQKIIRLEVGLVSFLSGKLNVMSLEKVNRKSFRRS